MIRPHSRSVVATGHGSCALPALLLLLAAVSLAGCLPPQADFNFGMSTSAISGEVTLERPETADATPLIVLLSHHYKFVETAPETTLTHPTVRVIRPDADGTFSVDWPSEVVLVELIFAAPEHLSQTFRFRRTLGVGEIVYRARLRHMPNWRSHFYTFLQPQLQEFITEPRYGLQNTQQQMLGDWLQAQQARLERQRQAAARDDGRERPGAE